MEVTLRPMTALDVPAVLALENTLFPHDAWPERFFYDELSQAAPQVPAHRATRRYWVAESQTGETPVICGYAGLMCVLPLADVQTIAVAPQAQGQGLGTRLLQTLEAAAREQSAEDLLLEVRQDNTGAQRLYTRFGFEQIHVRPGYYPDGGDALIMRKRLAEPKASSAANLRGTP